MPDPTSRPPEQRVSLRRVINSDEVRDNFVYPKFLELPTPTTDEVYVAIRDPFALDFFPHGTVAYEPKIPITYKFNKYFYYKGPYSNIVFYDETYDGLHGFNWGSYEIRMGDEDLTFDD